MATWGHTPVWFGGTAYENKSGWTRTSPGSACLGDQPGMLWAQGEGEEGLSRYQRASSWHSSRSNITNSLGGGRCLQLFVVQV